jgi:hypothetical protein
MTQNQAKYFVQPGSYNRIQQLGDFIWNVIGLLFWTAGYLTSIARHSIRYFLHALAFFAVTFCVWLSFADPMTEQTITSADLQRLSRSFRDLALAVTFIRLSLSIALFPGVMIGEADKLQIWLNRARNTWPRRFANTIALALGRPQRFPY